MSLFGLKILLMCLWIKSPYAIHRSNNKCSAKRITCLDDESYRFCFNTTSSTILYGNIKHCPKSTVCCEDEGKRSCIKKHLKGNKVSTFVNSADFVLANNSKQFVTTISPKLKNASTNRNKYGPMDVNTEKNILYTFSEKTTKLLATTSSTTTKKLKTTSKMIPFKQKITPLKRKKSTTKLQHSKRKRKPVLSTLKKFLLKSKTKSSHKRRTSIKTQHVRKPTKTHNFYFIKPNKIKYATSKTKKPNNILKRKPLITSTISTPFKKTFPKITNSSLENIPTYKSEEDLAESIIETKSAVDSNTSYTSTTEFSGHVVFTNLSTSNVITQSTLPSTPVQFRITTTIPRKTTSTIAESTTLTTSSIATTEYPKENIKMSVIATSKSPCYSPLIPATPNPCDFFQRFFLSSTKPLSVPVTTPATTESTDVLTGRPSLCRIPAKYPSDKCNEYHECKRVMWWFKWLLLKCEKGYAFDPITLNCVMDASCVI